MLRGLPVECVLQDRAIAGDDRRGVERGEKLVLSDPQGTLAHQLAAAIGCPALSRDEIKEGMVLSNPGFVASSSDALTMRTYGLFFDAMSLLLRAEVTLVAEAAFQHSLWVKGLSPLGDLPRSRSSGASYRTISPATGSSAAC